MLAGIDSGEMIALFPNEQEAYVKRLANDLLLSIDGQTKELQLIPFSLPTTDALKTRAKDQTRSIVLELAAERLLRNRHQMVTV